MLPTAVDEASVRAAALLAGVMLADEHVPGVVRYFQLLADFAARLESFELDESMDGAAVFTPCSPPTPTR